MSGSLFLIEGPTDAVVSLAEAKAMLRITDSDSDVLITALIGAAVDQLDPAGGGWLGRALRPQQWEIRCDGFPYGDVSYGYVRGLRSSTYAIELPFPPLISVDSVKYDDGDGVEQTLAVGVGYRVIGFGAIGKSCVAPIYNGSWPSSVRCDPESVRVRFTCGYEVGETTSPLALPNKIKRAVLLMVKDVFHIGERNLFVSSETVDGVGAQTFVVSENATKVMRSAAENLLSTCRVYD